MNEGGAVVGQGRSIGGPTVTASARTALKRKSLQQKVDGDIKNIIADFTKVVNSARVRNPPVRSSQEAIMMDVRAARMVQAADSLLKLVSELKQTTIYSGFASLKDHVDERTKALNQEAEKTDRILGKIAEEAASNLKDLESHYYSSSLRSYQSQHSSP